MISDNFEAIRELDILQIRATKERIISYLLQLASFCKRHTVQTRAPAEGIYRDRPDTRRDLYALDVAAPEPVITYPLCSIWNDNFFAIPEVPDQNISCHRLLQRTDFRGVLYLKAREIRFAIVCHVNLFETVTATKSTIPQHFQRRRECDPL